MIDETVGLLEQIERLKCELAIEVEGHVKAVNDAERLRSNLKDVCRERDEAQAKVEKAEAHVEELSAFIEREGYYIRKDRSTRIKLKNRVEELEEYLGHLVLEEHQISLAEWKQAKAEWKQAKADRGK